MGHTFQLVKKSLKWILVIKINIFSLVLRTLLPIAINLEAVCRGHWTTEEHTSKWWFCRCGNSFQEENEVRCKYYSDVCRVTTQIRSIDSDVTRISVLVETHSSLSPFSDPNTVVKTQLSHKKGEPHHSHTALLCIVPKQTSSPT